MKFFLIPDISKTALKGFCFSQFVALVSGYEGTCVWWENVAQEGFASLDISPLKSSSKKCYKNSAINSKPFYLSIPASKVVPVVELHSHRYKNKKDFLRI